MIVQLQLELNSAILNNILGNNQ